MFHAWARTASPGQCPKGLANEAYHMPDATTSSPSTLTLYARLVGRVLELGSSALIGKCSMFG